MARNSDPTKPTEPQGRLIDEDDGEGLTAGAIPNRQGRTNPRGSNVREPVRGLSRSAAVVTGRNGEILSRSVTTDGDPFHVPLELIPDGWEYQWNTYQVMGKEDGAVERYTLTMYQQGWRPVLAERYPGKFAPESYKGPILREGMRLEERPIQLSEEARNEDYRKAHAQLSDQNEALTGGKANLRANVKDGLELRPGGRGFRGRKTQLSIDPAYDIPAPVLSPADDSVS